METSTSAVLPEMLDGTRTIRFRCHRGIACWNACCSSIDIPLTPYDIVRLKHRLGLDSSEFLRRYTVPYEMEREGIAGVKLAPVDGGTACRFNGPEGCGVYEDRPTACRYYPVALLSMRRQGESTDRDAYALVREPHCRGHDEPREIAIDAYRAEQGLPEYDAMARGWRQLILKKKSSGPTLGKPSQRSLELFFMACYDIDRFRAFVESDGFRALYAIAPDEMAAMHGDDAKLLQFAFRFLRQVLFGEVTIATHAEATERLKQRFREGRARLEREAAERRARAEEAGEFEAD